MSDQGVPARRPGLAPLRQREIEQRIDRIIDEVLGSASRAAGPAGPAALQELDPAELVRRMQPFLALN